MKSAMSYVTDLAAGTAGAVVGMVDTMQTITPAAENLSLWPVVYALGALLIKEAGRIAFAYIRAKYGSGDKPTK